MTVSEITFGVEIECYVPYDAFPVGSRHAGLQIPNMPAGWNAQRDGSLHTRRRGFMAVEVVSPILRGADGLAQIKTVLEFLKSINASVNTACGFHVHVGVGTDRAVLNRILSLAANHEAAIYAATGTKARERGGYCAPISDRFAGVDLTVEADTDVARNNRFVSVNFCNVLSGGKPTIEFRAFAGTLNFGKIVMHIRLCVGLAERAVNMSRRGKWESRPPVATSPIHRKGVGHTAAVRLAYVLGWIKGRTNKVFGDLSAENLPTMHNSKKTLMTLAKKYDARP